MVCQDLALPVSDDVMAERHRLAHEAQRKPKPGVLLEAATRAEDFIRAKAEAYAARHPVRPKRKDDPEVKQTKEGAEDGSE